MNIHKSNGFTLIEMLIVVAVIGIISAVAVPGMIRARESGNEASAIGSIRSIVSAQTSFASTCGAGGYADSLTTLATAPPGGVEFISPDLGASDPSIKSGYSITVGSAGLVVLAAANTCNGVADSRADFLATATPTGLGTTGNRSFGADQRGSIYQDYSGATPVAPLAVAGTVSVLQ